MRKLHVYRGPVTYTRAVTSQIVQHCATAAAPMRSAWPVPQLIPSNTIAKLAHAQKSYQKFPSETTFPFANVSLHVPWILVLLRHTLRRKIGSWTPAAIARTRITACGERTKKCSTCWTQTQLHKPNNDESYQRPEASWTKWRKHCTSVHCAVDLRDQRNRETLLQSEDSALFFLFLDCLESLICHVRRSMHSKPPCRRHRHLQRLCEQSSNKSSSRNGTSPSTSNLLDHA